MNNIKVNIVDGRPLGVKALENMRNSYPYATIKDTLDELIDKASKHGLGRTGCSFDFSVHYDTLNLLNHDYKQQGIKFESRRPRGIRRCDVLATWNPGTVNGL